MKKPLYIFLLVAFIFTSLGEVYPLAPVSPWLMKPFDTRPMDYGMLHEDYVRHDMEVKAIVNPNNESKRAVYVGAGADVSNFLLSTNADEAYFVADYRFVTVEKLNNLKSFKDNLVGNYRENKYAHGFVINSFVESEFNKVLLAALAWELESIGVDLDTVVATEGDGGPKITFKWNYFGENEKDYSITFINGRVESSEQWLNDSMKEGKVDICYQRAGYKMAKKYKDGDNHIREIHKYMKEGGFFVTDDYARHESSDEGDRSRSRLEALAAGQSVSISALPVDNGEKYIDCGNYFPDLGLRRINMPGAEDVKQIIARRRLDMHTWPSVRERYADDPARAPDACYGWRVRIRQKVSDDKGVVGQSL